MATLTPGRVMKRNAELGSIAPGKLADMILVNGAPTINISDIRKVDLVVRRMYPDEHPTMEIRMR